ncbi:MAG: cell envelope biogenesis protein TolA [Beijerinckiaceae bacterium]
MKFRPTEPGLYVSAALHGALLLAALVSFSESRKFNDAEEAIPVDMITESQFNEVVKGVRNAPVAETPKPVVDRVAEVEETKPTPVVKEAKVDIAAPPPPQREPDPAPPEPPQAAAPPEPAPPVPKPPPRPPEPPKAEPPPKPEPPKPQAAEAIDPPKPPPRPRDLPKVESPKPEPPKTPPKPALDRAQIAALLEKQKKEDAAKKPKPPSGQEHTEQRRFDPNSIAKLLSREEPGQRASTGRTANQTASIGNPNATGQRMSPSMWGQLDGYMIEQYKRCWNYISLGPAARYIPQIEVSFTQTGGLRAEPRLRNQPSDPNLRALADSAMRAVKQCNPLRIPERFLPYYNEWKDRILRFDPDEMAG